MKSGHTADLTPLRNDINKIRQACQHFSQKNEISFSKRLTDFYESLAWPGNLRQLFGHLEKKKVLSRLTKLDFDYLDEELLLKSSDLLNITDDEEILPINDFKEEYIKKAVLMFEGNIAQVSKKLHVTEKTIKSILLKSS